MLRLLPPRRRVKCKWRTEERRMAVRAVNRNFYEFPLRPQQRRSGAAVIFSADESKAT